MLTEQDREQKANRQRQWLVPRTWEEHGGRGIGGVRRQPFKEDSSGRSCYHPKENAIERDCGLDAIRSLEKDGATKENDSTETEKDSVLLRESSGRRRIMCGHHGNLCESGTTRKSIDSGRLEPRRRERSRTSSFLGCRRTGILVNLSQRATST